MDVHEVDLPLQGSLIGCVILISAAVMATHVLGYVQIHCLTRYSTLLNLLTVHHALAHSAEASQVVRVAVIEFARKRHSCFGRHLDLVQMVLHGLYSLRRDVSVVGRTVFPLLLMLRLDRLVLVVVDDFWTLDLALVLLESLQLGRVDH